MTTQKQRVYQYMKVHGSITPMEAFTDLGITKLATRVSELRADGTAVAGEWVTSKNRFGKKVRYMRYTL